MPKCLQCGKNGIFLKVDFKTGNCKLCQEKEENRRIDELRASRMMKSGIEEEDKANNAVCLAMFMYYYNNAETFYSGVLDIEEKYSGFKYIKEYPNAKYKQLLRDKQWHMRDAIEREYIQIVDESKGIYKNNRSKTIDLCRNFIINIRKYKNEFDKETLQLVYSLLKKLSIYLNIDVSEDLPENYGENDYDQLSGYDFEFWCANLLRKNGYNSVELTRGSGDQGVDIIAEKDDIRYAIQCKRYSTDIGNKSVQEVVAGKSYYKCQVGVVMTNSHFTKSAKELANATGTLLWDRKKIQQLLSVENKTINKKTEIDSSENYYNRERKKEKAFPKLKRVKEVEPSEDDPQAYNYPPIDLLAQGDVEDTLAHGQRDMQKVVESKYDSKLLEAVDIALDLGQVSISMIQRKMHIDYALADRIINEMSRRGIVTEADGYKPREVLITREQANEMFEDCK